MSLIKEGEKWPNLVFPEQHIMYGSGESARREFHNSRNTLKSSNYYTLITTSKPKNQ